MAPSDPLVARCPSCMSVIEHRPEGRLYRCGRCAAVQDLMAELA